MTIRLTWARARITDTRVQGILLPLGEDTGGLTGPLQELDQATSGLLSRMVKHGGFGGEPYKIVMSYVTEGLPVRCIIIVGLGKKQKCDLEIMRGAGAKGFQYARDLGMQSIAIPAQLIELPGYEKRRALEAFLTGGSLGVYCFSELKTSEKDRRNALEECRMVGETEEEAGLAEAAVKLAAVVSGAVYEARDLVSLPPNRKTPELIAQRAKSMAREHRLRCSVISESKARKMGMGAFLAVSQGSREAARMIVLHYQGGEPQEAPVVLVGKGVTFDSGGISLKTPKSMEKMKDDMAGGAAVLGTLQAASQLKVPLNVIGIVPVTENLPGGNAYKPGDVLISLSGQTIEVVTTDAEGRLILADALTYAARFKPKAIVDLATLTGACVTALGDNVAGVMGNNQTLLEMVREAGEETGERVWPLPLWEEYADYLKSDIADFKNAGGGPAGAITGGVFLSKFVNGIPWVHLDIAGPAWCEKARPYILRGASGFGVRLLIQLLRNWKDDAL